VQDGAHHAALARDPPLTARSGRVRHWALCHGALHGERVNPGELLAVAGDAIGCEIAEDLFFEGSSLRAWTRLGAQSRPPGPGRDRIFPVDVFGARARELIPGASFVVLDGVGHVPMLDDPRLVARTILASAAARSHDDE